MIFYLIEIATGDSKIAGKAIYEYESEKEALANFHAKLGVAMKSDLYETELLQIIRSDGIIGTSQFYDKKNFEPISMSDLM